MFIKPVILYPGMQPSQIMGHGIKNTLGIDVYRSSAQISDESAVTLDVCKGSFRLDASVHPEHLSLFGIDPFILIGSETFEFF